MSESDETAASQDSVPENHVVEDMVMSFDPKGLRVLAVDDNIICLTVLSAMLKKCDYNVTGITDVAQALQILRENKDDFDIVITDARTPDMEDFYLLENLSNEFDIPILVLSASQETSDVTKAVKYGAKDYISKPPRLAIIKNIWQHVLRKSLFSDHNKSCIAKDHDVEQCSKPNEELEHQKIIKDEASDTKSDSKSKCINHEKKKKNVRINWTPTLHQKFVEVCQKLGRDAKPRQILMTMNEPTLTIQQISNHLQIFKRSLRNGNSKIDPFSNQKPSFNHFNMSLKQKLLHSQIMRSNIPQRYNSNREMLLTPPVPYCSGGGDANLQLLVYGGPNSKMNDHIFMDVSSQFSRPLPIMQQSLAEDVLPISYLGKDYRIPMPIHDGAGNFQNCTSSPQPTLYDDSFMGTSAQFSEENQIPLPVQDTLAGEYEGCDLSGCNGEVDFTNQQMNGVSSGILSPVNQDFNSYSGNCPLSAFYSELSGFQAGDYFINNNCNSMSENQNMYINNSSRRHH